MSVLPASNMSAEGEARLPRRDFVILPLLSLLTMAMCLAVAEGFGQHYFSQNAADSCMVEDNTVGFRYRPHCTSRLKVAEGPWVTNEYNDCGYRTRQPCAPRPAGTTRIALLGASVSEGLNIPYEKTFAERTARGLSQALGRPVEVQNMGRANASPISVFHQVDEALAMKPDLVLMVVDPYDIEHTDPRQMADRYKPIPSVRQGPQKAVNSDQSLLKRVENLAKESATATAGAHFLFQNSATYARIYLQYGDHADYLRKPLTPIWEQRLRAFDVLLGEMVAKTNAYHVPFVLVEVPSQAQMALSQMQTLPAGIDPYQLDEALHGIAQHDKAGFIDTLDALRKGAPTSQVYYVVDTHLNAAGHAIVSRVMIDALLKEERPALMCHQRAGR